MINILTKPSWIRLHLPHFCSLLCISCGCWTMCRGSKSRLRTCSSWESRADSLWDQRLNLRDYLRNNVRLKVGLWRRSHKLFASSYHSLFLLFNPYLLISLQVQRHRHHQRGTSNESLLLEENLSHFISFLQFNFLLTLKIMISKCRAKMLT